MAALHAVTQYSGNEEFGGVISIGGRFPESTRVTSVGKYRTPVLVCAGSRSQEVRSRYCQRYRGCGTRRNDVELFDMSNVSKTSKYHFLASFLLFIHKILLTQFILG